MMTSAAKWLGLSLVAFIAGCSTPPATKVVIGGTVTGLAGRGLVLEKSGEQLHLSANGAFAFGQKVATGAGWEVTLIDQPKSPAQTCTIEGGSGTAETTDVDSVRVTCHTDTFTLGGTVTGLSGAGLSLRTASGDRLPISANGPFTFTSRVESGSTFAVSIETQPHTPTQVCSVAGGTGTVGAGNITSVAVNCKTRAFTLGGAVYGLAGTVVLQNNGGADLTLTANGSFAFAAPLDVGTPYSVTVKTQPTSPSQTCVLGHATGTMGQAAVEDLTLDCTTNTFAVGGTVTGLIGTGLVLQLNGASSLAVPTDGPFTFTPPLASGTSWTVTVKDQPKAPRQVCTVSDGTGLVGGAPISSVAVACVTETYQVKATVSGLSGAGLVLRNRGGDDLAVASDGVATFATAVASGAAYAVTVQAQPSAPSQTCVVSNGAGDVIDADITNVTVSCTTNRYAIGGTVSGLYGAGLVLENNGGDTLAISGNGAFTFPVRVASGSSWLVTVGTQPSSPSQTCTVAGGTGTVGAANVGSVAINCTTNRYTIGGTASGLAAGATLQLNNSEDLVVSADGTFAFATPLLSRASYAVTIKRQPTSPWQTCVVGHGSGTVAAAPVTDVTLTCTTNRYAVGGEIAGLTGAGLVLQDNLGDDLPVTADGSFTFPTTVASGTGYAVTVKTQPTTPWQHCTVSAGSGTIAGASVSAVRVACTTQAYTIGGTVSGLLGTGLVLQDNGGNDLSVTADGTFTFGGTRLSGQPYSVTVKTQPTSPWQTCAVTDGGGTVAGANVTSVAVACTTNAYAVGGSVSGLSGAGLVLQNNAGDDLPVTGNGAFAFITHVPSNGTYAVTVKTQPTSPWQTCSVTSAAGTVTSAAITTVVVTCVTDRHPVSGTVSGLSGAGLVLQDNAGDDLSVSANGTFTFATSVASGAAYAVTVKTQPTSPWQTCLVSNGTGTIAGAAVSDVAVACTTNAYAIGGTVSGLSGAGLTLQDNAGDDLSVSANGAFTFATNLASGATYSVTVKTQPTNPWQTCAVTSGGGTVAGANVTAVSVTCTTDQHPVSGTVSGLSGAGLVLQDNAGDDLAVSANGAFTFATSVASGAAYAVTVKTQPTNPWQTCLVSNGTGTIAGAAVSDVAVACTTNTYAVGGTVSGLSGSGLVLRNNGGDDLSVGANGAFTFATHLASATSYAVTVATQPSSPAQTCTVTSGAGTLAGAAITSVSVTCVNDNYSVGGTVSGLSGAGLVLRNNGSDDLPISANGAFTFATLLAAGNAFSVTVFTQPLGQTCTVTNGAGSSSGANVTNVSVSCALNPYTLGGTVTGLSGSGLVLTNNGVDPKSLSANGAYTFAATMSAGQAYAVAVQTQPSSPTQTCVVANGSGTMPAGNVGNVNVTCTTNTYSVGGNVTGLSGSGLVLRNNGGDALSVAANGSFTFSTNVASGAAYVVTVGTQPTTPWQTCTVTNGSGTMVAGAVANVAVSCTTNSYTISATVSGLIGSGLVIQNNGGQNKAIATNSTVSFASQLSGSTYGITVLTQPSAPTQTCFVSAGSGTVGGADVAASVLCTPASCKALKAIQPGAASGVYTVDPDGAGAQPSAQVYCDMTTNGGGWTVMAYIRTPSEWDWLLGTDHGTVGDVTNGFASGATLTTQNDSFKEKMVVFRNLIEGGSSLGTQYMVNTRSDGVPIPYASIATATGWSYSDSFGYSLASVVSVCSHGCGSYRTFGMFNQSTTGLGWMGTQGGDYGCRDGNNICVEPRGYGCNVGANRCAYLTGAGEGTVYLVR